MGTGGRPAVRDDPALAAYVRRLRDAGLSYHAIAAELDAAGVPTIRGGEHWRSSAVQSVLGYRRPRTLHQRVGTAAREAAALALEGGHVPRAELLERLQAALEPSSGRDDWLALAAAALRAAALRE